MIVHRDTFVDKKQSDVMTSDNNNNNYIDHTNMINKYPNNKVIIKTFKPLFSTFSKNLKLFI